MDAIKASESNKPKKEGFSKTLSKFINSHVALLSIELIEAKKYATAYLIHIIMLVVAMMSFFIFCSVGIIVYFWENHRLTAIFCVACFYLVIFIISLLSLARLTKQTELFVSSKEELAKDMEMFLNE